MDAFAGMALGLVVGLAAVMVIAGLVRLAMCERRPESALEALERDWRERNEKRIVGKDG